MHQHRLRRWIAGTALGLGAVAVAACDPVGLPGGGTPPSTSSTSTTAAPPTTDPGDGLSLATQQQMVALVNAQRATGRSCGTSGTFGPAAPLTYDADLAEAAQAHSADMAQHDVFSHTGSNGSTPLSRITAAGYQPAAWAENIAAGNADPAATVAAWFASPTHCANFMSPNLTEIGFGYDAQAGTTYTHYWTADLGRPA